MRIKRAIVVPAILILSAVGSVLTASAVPAAVAQASSAHASVTASSVVPDVFYHE